jgi:alkanesulfonate monooxygenase SsuD/methylene tetrahydromethanopterin reductase-like flavin-dependent oxidoreductase (luciferase family)
MKVGLYIRLLGRSGTDAAPPTWGSIRDQARAAEAAGLDIVVLEDGLLYGTEPEIDGVWEGVTMAAAVAATTKTIGVGQAVMNSPYRYPGRVAAIANSLDEISGGRYTLGIGAGNTPDDYPRFGIDADPRYSRFAEAIEIIHGLLRRGRMTFEGDFYRVRDARLPLRGPRAAGPPISIAAGKPRMLRLAARFGDEWNWWTGRPGDLDELRPLVDEADRACAEIGRDPSSLRRSIDVFSIVSGGSPDQAAETLFSYGRLGFDEVRCELQAAQGTNQLEAIDWISGVVARVHAA